MTLLTALPTELQHYTLNFLSQYDLLKVSLVSHHFHHLAASVLYNKIYLNDSKIEQSDTYKLATTWSWFPLQTTNKTGEKAAKANQHLEHLVRAFEENPTLAENVIEVRLNWDLDIPLQKRLIEVLMENSSSLQFVDNVTDPLINKAVEASPNCKNLLSLDLPPPNPLPTLEVPESYIPDLRRFLSIRLSQTIKSLTLFMDPAMMFNSVTRLSSKLEIDTLKLHCRADTYPTPLYRREHWTRPELKDIFDVRYLKTLTIISWFDHLCPDRVYKFDQWAAFENLEDITLIAVTYNDDRIANFIRSCRKLRRLKLDFTVTLRCMPKTGEVYKAIMKHKEHMEFLDVKVEQSYKVMNLDLREFNIVLRAPCQCDLCQKKVVAGIFKKKILPGLHKLDQRQRSFEIYEKAQYYEHLQSSNLFPYSKAVDRFPSVKTGPEDIDSFLDRFNEMNEDRAGYKSLTRDDFFDLYHCLIHTFKTDLDPFVNNFPKLKFFVFNEISFVIKTKEGKRYPTPLFYSEGFDPDVFLNPSAYHQAYERVLYLN